MNDEGRGKSLENAVHFELRSGQDFTEHFTLEMPVKVKTLKHENSFSKGRIPFCRDQTLRSASSSALSWKT